MKKLIIDIMLGVIAVALGISIAKSTVHVRGRDASGCDEKGCWNTVEVMGWGSELKEVSSTTVSASRIKSCADAQGECVELGAITTSCPPCKCECNCYHM